jgi:hypothetical protein
MKKPRGISTFISKQKRLKMLHEACRSALPAPRGNIESVTFSGDGQPEAVLGARVSSNFLDILGMRPILGRSFLAEEDKTGGTPVVMVSADFWRRRFNADLQVIGLRSPDSTDTPFTEILTRFANTQLRTGSLDLQPQMELRIEKAY